MPKIVPKNWRVRDKDVQWAIEKFDIDRDEVMRQIELMVDYEFKRSYNDFDRVFRNWIRKADEISSLRKVKKYRQPESITEDQLAEDRRKWEEDMERLGVSPFPARSAGKSS